MNKLMIIKIGGMNNYCKAFTYSWNNSTNNNWKYALKHFEKWLVLSCRYASKPYYDWRISEKINVVNLKWGKSWDTIRKSTFAKSNLRVHVFAQLAHSFVCLQDKQKEITISRLFLDTCCDIY